MSDYLILFLFVIVLFIGIVKKLNCFDLFIEGAKSGLSITINMFGNLLVFMVAISFLISSGILDFIESVFHFEYSKVLIQAIVRPFSSSASLSMLIDNYQSSGVDSTISIYSTMIHYVSDATFYLVPFYMSLYSIKEYDKIICLGFIVNIFSYIVSIVIVILFM